MKCKIGGCTLNNRGQHMGVGCGCSCHKGVMTPLPESRAAESVRHLPCANCEQAIKENSDGLPCQNGTVSVCAYLDLKCCFSAAEQRVEEKDRELRKALAERDDWRKCAYEGTRGMTDLSSEVSQLQTRERAMREALEVGLRGLNTFANHLYGGGEEQDDDCILFDREKEFNPANCSCGLYKVLKTVEDAISTSPPNKSEAKVGWTTYIYAVFYPLKHRRLLGIIEP